MAIRVRLSKKAEERGLCKVHRTGVLIAVHKYEKDKNGAPKRVNGSYYGQTIDLPADDRQLKDWADNQEIFIVDGKNGVAEPEETTVVLEFLQDSTVAGEAVKAGKKYPVPESKVGGLIASGAAKVPEPPEPKGKSKD